MTLAAISNPTLAATLGSSAATAIVHGPSPLSMEVFPVGLIVTLVSAAILRTKPTPDAPAAAAAVLT